MQLSEKEKYVVAMVEPHLIKASNDVEIDFEVIKYEIKTILEQLTND
jgi:fructose-bisphosphate aldolase class 1